MICINSKKIALITWVRGYNFGTQLQAYSMYQLLSQKGYDVSLFNDDILSGISKENEFVQCPAPSSSAHNSPSCQSSRIKYYLKKIKKAIYIFADKKRYHNYLNLRKKEKFTVQRKSVFDAFKRNYLKIGNPIQKSELEKLGRNFDIYICGSDQIWTYKNKFQANYYYLGFTDDKKRRISYAPVIGNQYPIDAERELKVLVKRFDALSARDEFGKRVMEYLSKKKVPIVLDPVLLHTSKEWIDLFSIEKRPEKYLLCYLLGPHQWYENYVNDLAKHLNLKIKWIPVNPIKNIRHIKPYDPKEFVKLICNASYVCTDSYHGTLFSLLFNKPFSVLSRYTDAENKENERFYTLFRLLDLRISIIQQKDFNPSDIQPIEYDQVNERLIIERENSLNYLIAAIDAAL